MISEAIAQKLVEQKLVRIETPVSEIVVMAVEFPRAAAGETLTDAETLASHAEKLIRQRPPRSEV